MFSFSGEYPEDKSELYGLLAEQLRALCEGERRAMPCLANASALIAGALGDINWCGFYVAQGRELVLGPFQGSPACISIPFGKGVCGTAAERGSGLMVPDVLSFPGHIACDAASRSEIVTPIIVDGGAAAVLDIDSPLPSRFDEDDVKGLAELCRILAEAVDWK